MEDISKMRSFVANDILCIVGEEGCLGAGSFGVVQCVRHPSLGWIAVKCFPVIGRMSARELVVKQIQNEIAALQQANHENILRVYGWAQWEGSVALVTELMPAGSLRMLLANQGVPLHPVLRLRMCEEVSDGIAFIHNFSSTKRLTHGDLKPENILLTKYLCCKVGDFGGARVAHYTGQTTATDVVGSKQQMTPIYAAPERLRQLACRPKKEHDTYSFGLIAHGILSRETPTQYSASESKYLDWIIRGERPDIEAIDELEESLTTNEEKEIIQVLRSVMIRCWQDKPTDRPDMRDVRDQLHQLMSKQKPSDVLRSVGEALDKMTILVPEQLKHQCLPLNCFNPQTKKFKDGEPAREVPADRTTESSNPVATIASTRITSQAGNATKPPSERKNTSASTSAATISSTVDLTLTVNHPADDVGQLASTVEAATISTASFPDEKNVRSKDGNGRKPTLKEAFESSDRSRLPELVKEAPDLLEKYKSCLATSKMEEAKRINNKIIYIIKNEIDATGLELQEFADDLRLNDEGLESIPFYVASASLYKEKGGEDGLKWKGLVGMGRCVWGMLWVNKKMVRDDVNIKPVVTVHVIPLMRHIKDEMETVTSVDDNTKCREVMQVLTCVGESEELIDERVAMETYKEGVERFKTTFGNEAKKREIHGVQLTELGDLYKKISRFDDATSCYQQAIEAYKAATAVSEERWKKSWIEECEKKLREVQ